MPQGIDPAPGLARHQFGAGFSFVELLQMALPCPAFWLVSEAGKPLLVSFENGERFLIFSAEHLASDYARETSINALPEPITRVELLDVFAQYPPTVIGIAIDPLASSKVATLMSRDDLRAEGPNPDWN
ncbi:MAG TPA: hypothetical protein VG826_06260 [Pirellulales bacterium]|nr:hypothetical protein [Pirellulales bacterium]